MCFEAELSRQLLEIRIWHDLNSNQAEAEFSLNGVPQHRQAIYRWLREAFLPVRHRSHPRWLLLLYCKLVSKMNDHLIYENDLYKKIGESFLWRMWILLCLLQWKSKEIDWVLSHLICSILYDVLFSEKCVFVGRAASGCWQGRAWPVELLACHRDHQSSLDIGR